MGGGLFEEKLFGGVQARRKYGYLAPEYMRGDWSEEDRYWSRIQIDLTDAFKILFADECIPQHEVQRTRPSKPSKPTWLRDGPPRSLETKATAQER